MPINTPTSDRLPIGNLLTVPHVAIYKLSYSITIECPSGVCGKWNISLGALARLNKAYGMVFTLLFSRLKFNSVSYFILLH